MWLGGIVLEEMVNLACSGGGRAVVDWSCKWRWWMIVGAGDCGGGSGDICGGGAAGDDGELLWWLW